MYALANLIKFIYMKKKFFQSEQLKAKLSSLNISSYVLSFVFLISLISYFFILLLKSPHSFFLELSSIYDFSKDPNHIVEAFNFTNLYDLLIKLTVITYPKFGNIQAIMAVTSTMLFLLVIFFTKKINTSFSPIFFGLPLFQVLMTSSISHIVLLTTLLCVVGFYFLEKNQIWGFVFLALAFSVLPATLPLILTVVLFSSLNIHKKKYWAILILLIFSFSSFFIQDYKIFNNFSLSSAQALYYKLCSYTLNSFLPFVFSSTIDISSANLTLALVPPAIFASFLKLNKDFAIKFITFFVLSFITLIISPDFESIPLVKDYPFLKNATTIHGSLYFFIFLILFSNIKFKQDYILKFVILAYALFTFNYLQGIKINPLIGSSSIFPIILDEKLVKFNILTFDDGEYYKCSSIQENIQYQNQASELEKYIAYREIIRCRPELLPVLKDIELSKRNIDHKNLLLLCRETQDFSCIKNLAAKNDSTEFKNSLPFIYKHFLLKYLESLKTLTQLERNEK
jgi:hypothetical protein